MTRTEVGYAGGTTPSPTYHDLERHAEVVQVEFDPTRLDLRDILELFWSGHDPHRHDRGQYRAILLCETEAQRDIAAEFIDRFERTGPAVGTEVVVGLPFHPAEAYHQKWKLRQRRDLFADLARLFDDEWALLRSRQATKLNALVAGHLTAEQIERELPTFRLSDAGTNALRSLLPRRLRAVL